jgi:hypothetical protein
VYENLENEFFAFSVFVYIFIIIIRFSRDLEKQKLKTHDMV